MNKKLKYILGEVIIVVLGIIIAVQLNNLNDYLKSQKEEKIIVALLNEDLALEKYKLKYFIKDLDKGATYLSMFTNGSDSINNLDSLSFYLQRAFIHQKSNAAYLNLKYSGKLDLITNQDILADIVKLYETAYDGFSYVSNDNLHFKNHVVIPYIIDNLTIKLSGLNDPKEVKLKLATNKLQNLIKNQYLSYSQTSAYLNSHLSSIDAILENIKNEYGD